MGTILVTGGCGYIGSHTCISLIENNYKVLIIDSLENSYIATLSKIKEIFLRKGIDVNNSISFIKGDLKNKQWLDTVFYKYSETKNPITSVIHCAGLKSTESSFVNPLEYWDTNLSITLSLLTVMKKYSCYNMIFSSSATVYKHKENNLLKESDPLEPTSPYGRTKLTIELILKDFLKSNLNEPWRIVNLRYFNPVGAHSSSLIGENPKENNSNLFPAIMKVLAGQEKHLYIYGNDWPTKDGTCIRDFIHVMDLADAHVASLNYLISNIPNIVSINIGTGRGTSILEIMQIFSNLGYSDLKIVFSKKRLGDHCYVVADNKKALKLLNWSPKRNIVDMCKDTINYKKNFLK